ncbi:MAG: hypothetical protein NXI10_08215 [bacterium]|nr:hypothetical protein [bacterium]
MKQYPEIEQLSSLRKQFAISIHPFNVYLCNRSDFPKVEFKIGSKSYHIFVDDEYHDFKKDNPDLHLCLVLRTLEMYEDAPDFLAWCTQFELDASNSTAREHHMELGHIYRDIEQQVGTVDSYISDLDFQLNAGAAQELRRLR